ncbi:Gfo/Idh/MocA family protein [Yimella sp. cx-51]|uniref:Gfo/Idh/MocA family protein n=1 Tax=Yimella sp. cx-51 TaxID=2770551 RepID=UPI001FCACB0A|nr:Gfo/Idh/MocA family oxidoreductase [Yimella sp. cx-51]
MRSATRSTVVAVGSRDAGRAAAFAQEFDIPRSYGDYASVAADPEVEAVYVASPHSEHRDHALLALRTGKPVLVEKALARNEREVHQMFAAAEEANLFAMEAMWTRFLPHIDWVRSRIAAGAIGEVVTVTADHGQSLDLPDAHRLKNPDLAGGALLDLGVYPISFAVDLLGGKYGITRKGLSRPRMQLKICSSATGGRECRVDWKARANSYYRARQIEYGYIYGYARKWGHCPPGQLRSCK